jgi:triacylglycerol lipase
MLDRTTALVLAMALILVAGVALRLARRLLPPPTKARGTGWPAPQRAARTAARQKPSTTRYPILLAHGYFGFDRIGAPQAGREYFRGVRQRLEAQGHAVHVARVSPAAGIRRRAAQLARQIEQVKAPRLNIIAHSMGGLDARYAISRLGLSERVASLTTIGTPHHGTPLADLMFSFGNWRALRGMLDVLGANVDGLYDVSTPRMQHFNRAILDSPHVVYHSVVGAVVPGATTLNAWLALAHDYLLRKAGRNDGIVPAASQRWGEAMGEVEADHWAQIGWFGRFDVQTFYGRLAQQLAERGL